MMATPPTNFSWQNFLESYGLKAWDADDVREGMAISNYMETNAQDVPDTSHSLADIRRCLPVSISSTLIDIQNHKLPPKATSRWIQNLECLYMKPNLDVSRIGMERKEVSRCLLDPRDRQYLAVSYTWDPSEGEATTSGAYWVEKRDGTGFSPTDIRDIVLHRVIKFTQYCGCKYFWIDKECINQEDSVQKELAIQSMDLVYHFSVSPVALLSICINDVEHLNILAELLKGNFVTERVRLKLRVGITSKMKKALKVLENITATRWWTRAWTFQEDYRAGTKMTLLLPHTQDLEGLKIALALFGTLEGELCVNSAKFRTEATRFCLAYKNEPRVEDRDAKICDLILRRAGKYTVLLEQYSIGATDTICTPMSPLVFRDLGSRELKEHFNILAIAANVCNYPVRLNTKTLQDGGCSLSMALLALYLLNGEIITNFDYPKHGDSQALLTDTVLRFLGHRSLRSFSPPVARKLTFAKNCRFVDVSLTNDGMQTKGHIWKLGKRVAVVPSFKPVMEDDASHGLTSLERQWLEWLVFDLGSGRLGSRYRYLAAALRNYLEEDAATTRPTAAKDFKDCMARDIVEAMKLGKTIRLASITDSQRPESSSPYSGLVVENSSQAYEYIFTSWGRAGTFNNSSKHVSLGVNMHGCTKDGLPKLETVEWVNGLFFDNSDSRPAVFPWPTSFTK